MSKIFKLFNEKTEVLLFGGTQDRGIVTDIDFAIIGADLKQGDVLELDDPNENEWVESLVDLPASLYCPSLEATGLRLVDKEYNSGESLQVKQIRLRIMVND